MKITKIYILADHSSKINRVIFMALSMNTLYIISE